MQLSGGCLCGAVRYSCTSEPLVVGHCQCEDCRRSSGSGHCTHVAVPASALTVTGRVTFFDRAADSGNIVSRGFCPTCGSALYSRNAAMPDLAFVRASSLDDPNAVVPTMVVYASRGPLWDFVDPALPSYATLPETAPGLDLSVSRG